MRAVSLDSSRLPASKGLMSASLLVLIFVCSSTFASRCQQGIATRSQRREYKEYPLSLQAGKDARATGELSVLENLSVTSRSKERGGLGR